MNEVVDQQKASEKNAVLVDKQVRQDLSLVAGLVRKSNRILATSSSHRLPFDLFPDTINVEEGRITVISRDFFFSSQVHSVDLEDISNVFINTRMLFAQLVVVSKTFKENQIKIEFLRKSDAIYIRRIIEGLRVLANKKIDTSIYSKKELIQTLVKLSTTEIVV